MDIYQADGGIGIGRYTIEVYDSQTGVLKRTYGPYKNLWVSSSGNGRNLVMQNIAGTGSPQIQIDEAQLGDDDTAPANSDTALGNALVTGIIVANKGVSDNQATIEFFEGDANVPNDEYKEIGLLANGKLCFRSLIDPSYTKASGEDTKINYQITLNAS